MKILLVTPGMQSPWVDGRITSLLALSEALAARDVSVEVLTTGPQDQGQREYCEKGVRYQVLPGGSKGNWLKMLKCFWRLAKKDRVDQVVYRPFSGFNLVNIVSVFSLWMLSLLRRVPFNLSLWSGPQQLLMVPWLFSTIMVSSKVDVASSRVVPIRPLVEMAPVASASWDANPLKQYGFAEEDRVCLFTYCGKLNVDSLWRYTMERRGLGDLIAAAAQLNDIPNLKFLVSIPVLATSEGRKRLLDLLRAAGIEDRFVLTPAIDNLAEVLSAVDTYLYPVNIEEPSWAPISMLEALACDTPVITTSTPIIQEFMSTEEVLMYEPGRADQLSDLIRLVLDDCAEVSGRTARGRAKVAALNSSSGVAEQILAVLDRSSTLCLKNSR